MVRDIRIKEYIFPSFAVAGSVRAEQYSDHTLNGEIIKVRIAGGIASPGSFWFGESGGTTFFRQNNVTSGLSNVEYYPLRVAVAGDGVGGVTVGSFCVPSVVNGPIYYAASGLTSGTGALGPITVYYR